MKPIRTLSILALAAFSIAAGPQPPVDTVDPVPIELQWNWTNPIPPDAFCIYQQTNITLAFSNWTRIAVLPGQNLSVTNAVVPTTNFVFSLPPGVYFWAASATNMWGESPFSNVASSPPVLPSGNGLRVIRH